MADQKTNIEVARERARESRILIARDIIKRQAKRKHQVLSYSPVINIDFLSAPIQSVTLSGNVTFTTSNLHEYSEIKLRIISDGFVYQITFPEDWIFLNGALANINPNQEIIITLMSFGSEDSFVRVVLG